MATCDTADVARWPLTGRDDEVRRLRAMLLEPTCPGVSIVAPSGVGRTRLAQEMVTLAAAAGLTTASAAASHAAAGLPFGALASLLPDDPPPAGKPARTDLVRRSAEAIVARAHGGRLVLVVDDAHLLDAASADLLTHIASTNRAFVLVTARSGVPVPIADHLLETFELPALGDDAMTAIATTIVGGALDERAAFTFVTRSKGNVLFLRELVLGALDDGSLREQQGVWCLTGPLTVSDRLVELVESHIANLAPAARQLLEVLAIGEPLSVTDCAELGDATAMPQLERDDLVTVCLDGARRTVRLAHPVHGEVLRARLPGVAVARLAKRLAETVERRGARRRDDLLRLATWRLTAGDARPDTMLAAAVAARWRFGFPLAERLARAAMHAGAGFDAALLAAQLAGFQGRIEDANRELEALADMAVTDEQRAAVALIWIDNAAFGVGGLDRAVRIADDASARIEDPAWRDEIAARRTVLLLVTEGARAAADAAVPLLDRTTGRPLVWACMAAGLGLSRLGRLDEALAATRTGHDAHVALPRPLDWSPWFHLMIRCRILAQLGRFDEAQTLARTQYEEGLASGSTEQQGFFALFFAQVVGERGQVVTSARRAREGADLFRQLGRPTYWQDCLVRLALAEALRGDHAAAAVALQDAEAVGPVPLYVAVDLELARAWTTAAAGDLRHAREQLLRAAELGESAGDHVGAAAALHGVARLGGARDVVERLEALVAPIDGDLAPARVAHTRGLVSHDAEALDAASRAFEWMGAWLLAAEAAADTAEARRRLGDRRGAGVAEQRAIALAGWCEGARTPALAGLGVRWQLSPAEHETALLAAAGRSNREIADHLGLSVRTVENRLQHIYEKLDVRSRGELAAVIGG